MYAEESEDSIVRKQEKVAAYIAVAAALLFFLLALRHFRYTPDDAFIYFQYAKKIALGKGFSFNEAQPSYGVTGPLWALFIAAGLKLGLSAYAVAKSFDLLFACLSVAAMYLLASEILRNRTSAFIASAIFSMDAWLLRWSASGMETSPAILMAIAAVWLSLKAYNRSSAIVFACLTLVRPEGGLLFAIMFFRSFFRGTNGERSFLDRMLPAVWYGAVLAPWLTFSYFHFGKITPNSLGGKSAGVLHTSDVLQSTFAIIKITAATQLPIIAAGLARFLFRIRPSHWSGNYFTLAWVLLLPAFYVLDSVQVVSRYLLITLPFLVLAGFITLEDIISRFHLSARRSFLMTSAVAVLTLCQNQILYWTIVSPHLDNFAYGTVHCLQAIGSWLRDNTREDALVFVPDVGVIGFYSDRNICDTGLITPDVGKAFRGYTYDEGMMHRRYRAVVRPDFVVDRSPLPERLASDSLSAMFTKQFPGLGLSNDAAAYYTIYKVLR